MRLCLWVGCDGLAAMRVDPGRAECAGVEVDTDGLADGSAVIEGRGDVDLLGVGAGAQGASVK